MLPASLAESGKAFSGGVIGPQREEVSALPDLAHSPTQREIGEKEGERWGGRKRCVMGRGGEEKCGER